jgi:hypothetical protein
MLRPMYVRWLGVTAASYVVFHHLGLIPGGLGSAPSSTQVVDWLDLLVPFLVLGPAAAVLVAADASRRTWAIFGIGAITYATGHGVHLAANSVGNARPSPTAHLWDEVVGHYVWYAGVAIAVAALAATMAARARPDALGYVMAAAVGITWASNAVGGGTEIFSLVLALAAASYGWRRRHELGVVLAVAGAVAAVCLVGTWLTGAT